MIYLISSDVYSESLYLDFYASCLEDVPKLIEKYHSDIFSNEVRNVTIKEEDFGIRVSFEHKSSWEEDEDWAWDSETYVVRAVPNIE